MPSTKKFSIGKKVALIIIISVIVIIILSLFIFKFFSGSMGEHSFDEENLKASGNGCCRSNCHRLFKRKY